MSIEEIIAQALAEDIGDGDHTTLSTIPAGATGRAQLLIKENGILCGIEVARKVFHQVDPSLELEIFLRDGAVVQKGDIAFIVSGKTASILQSERLVLNFMQRMSGIATATRRITDLVKDLPVKLSDTRKTTPLLRQLEKYAVRTGGGINHRMGLYDMIMIKDNHVDYAGGIAPAIDRVQDYLKKNNRQLKIEIEIRNFAELDLALQHGGIDRIMLDNFCIPDLKKAVELIAGRYETEASGGINATNVRDYALTGVDFISIGALTHQIKSLDMSLKAMNNKP